MRYKKQTRNRNLTGQKLSLPPKGFETSLDIDQEEQPELSNWNTTRWLASDTQSNEIEAPQDAEVDSEESSSPKVHDPALSYLRELGSIPLLDREEEIRLAQKIEEGEATIK